MDVSLVYKEHCIRVQGAVSAAEIKRKAELVRELFGAEPEVRLTGTWERRDAPAAPLVHFRYPRTVLRIGHQWLRIGEDEDRRPYVRPFWLTDSDGNRTECRSIVEIRWR